MPPPELKKKTTQVTMIATVTRGSAFIVAAVRTFVRSLEQTGQRMPTDVAVMQSGQIGRPQFEQETPVSRLEWR